MTPQNVMDYVKVYENHVPIDVCKSACENLTQIKWQEHCYFDEYHKKSISYDHELSVSHDFIPEAEFINKQIWYALERYILKDFKSFNVWHSNWNGYSLARFNKYDPLTRMKLHCDHIHTIFDGQRRGIPVLTVLGVLNDDYEGGEFLLFEDKEIKMPAGSVIVFPSNFMYPHEVKPVKSGIRYSYVSWSW